MAVDINKILGNVGGVAVALFGKQAAIGVLIGLMDGVTPRQCYDSMKCNQSLFGEISDQDLIKIRNVIKRVGFTKSDLTDQKIQEAFQKDRPDLVGVVINYPGGTTWFLGQIDSFRKRLFPE